MSGNPETKQIFFDATVEEVAVSGIESVRTKKMAKRTGYAESLLYLYFKNKDDMLTQTYFEMDRRVAEICEAYFRDSSNDGKTLDEVKWDVWRIVFRYLVRNADTTLFFLRYRRSEYFTEAVKAQAQSETGTFEYLYRVMEERFGVPGSRYKNIYLNYIFEQTLYFAHMVNSEKIEATPEIEKVFFDSIGFTSGSIRDALSVGK